MVIAVDFDGTIVEHRYPEIGKEIPFATATLRQLIAMVMNSFFGQCVKEICFAMRWSIAENVGLFSLRSIVISRKKMAQTATSLAKSELISSSTTEM